MPRKTKDNQQQEIQNEEIENEEQNELNNGNNLGEILENIDHLTQYIAYQGEPITIIQKTATAFKMYADIYRSIKKIPGEGIVMARLEVEKKSMFNLTSIPNDLLEEALDNLIKNEYLNPEDEIKDASKKYESQVPAEEDRIKENDTDIHYDDMQVKDGEIDIMSRCAAVKGQIKNAKTLSNDELKSHIETLHLLRKADDARPWYSKVWQAIKGFFTGKNDATEIDDLQNSIIEASPYTKEFTEKAINAKYERHLKLVLSVSAEKLKNGEMKFWEKAADTREQIVLNDNAIEPELGNKENQKESQNKSLLEEYDIINDKDEETLQNS